MKFILISATVIFAVFLIVLSQIPIGIEPLTELYFENHTSLASNVKINETNNFAFTINNLEHQRVRYLYNVSAFNESGSFLFNIDYGELILEHNKSAIIEENFLFNENFNRSKILVEIRKDLSLETPDFKKKLWWPDPNYPMKINIHFWVLEE